MESCFGFRLIKSNLISHRSDQFDLRQAKELNSYSILSYFILFFVQLK